MSSSEEQDFLKNVKQVLDRQAETLDAGCINTLRDARRKALQGRHSRRKPWVIALPSALTAVLSLSLLLWYIDEPTHKTDPIEDLAIVVSEQNLEFYQEMDFYTWLAELENAG